jgi:hypothetical protein
VRGTSHDLSKVGQALWGCTTDCLLQKNPPGFQSCFSIGSRQKYSAHKIHGHAIASSIIAMHSKARCELLYSDRGSMSGC